jgi:hypothetical protein
MSRLMVRGNDSVRGEAGASGDDRAPGMERDIVLSRATDAIWLNYPFPVVFWRALRRTSRRIVLREKLFGGNRETFRISFLSRDSILWWVIRTHRVRSRLCREIFSTGAGSHVRLTELRRPRDAQGLVESLRRAAGG